MYLMRARLVRCRVQTVVATARTAGTPLTETTGPDILLPGCQHITVVLLIGNSPRGCLVQRVLFLHTPHLSLVFSCKDVADTRTRTRTQSC